MGHPRYHPLISTPADSEASHLTSSGEKSNMEETLVLSYDYHPDPKFPNQKCSRREMITRLW